MTKADLEEQLRAFFEHNPLDDDMMYLKSYVKDHPDNKMGWYLLGKEYAARGKEGKAKYCFAQAGEVYEAFEKKKVKLGILEEVKVGRAMLPGQTGRNRPWIRAGRLAGAVLTAVLLGSFLIGDGESGSSTGTDAESVDRQRELIQEPSAAEPASAVRILYSNPLEPIQEGELLRRFLLPGNERSRRTMLVEGKLTADGKWVDGAKLPEPLISGQTIDSGLQVSYHQAEACNCTPGGDKEAAEVIRSWVDRQEEAIVLQSAIRAYRNRYGDPLPDTIDGLVRNFPDNLLPGYTEGMKEAYAGFKASSMDQERKPGVLASRLGSGLFNEPLEILIDKRAHRLALVSGSVILRSYPVGLGGAKTPEGTFFITDKVKNPNGRDDGDFGSRGMQLSDTDYAIHGTNEPRSIGEDRSLGCVRMLKEDIEELFDMVPSGTKVTIGGGNLPADTIRKEDKFRLPALREERNPNKVYRWLS